MVVTALSEQGAAGQGDPIRVAILGGDPVAGQALELLLQGIGCDARFVAEPFANHAGEWLDRVQLLLIPPTLHPERREVLLPSVNNTPRTARLPIVELADAPSSGKSPHGRYALSWPCRVEELMRRMEAAVADRPGQSAAYG
jgi:hypothetical protein